jgi:phosphogluconate dehydratase
MDALVDTAEWNARTPELASLQGNRTGLGRELFALMRTQVGTAEQGACSLVVAEAP